MRVWHLALALTVVAPTAWAVDYENKVTVSTAAGQPVQIGSHTSSWDGRCVALALPAFVVVAPPKNGSITTEQGTKIAGNSSTGKKSCPGKTFPALVIIYHPNAGFHGDEVLQYAVRYGSGEAVKNVTVHVQ